MRRCSKCGEEIVNGVNGCSFMTICFRCNGGPPEYPDPIVIAGPIYDEEDIDELEDLILDRNEIDD